MTDESIAKTTAELDDEGLRSASPIVLRTLVRFHRKERDTLRKQLDESREAIAWANNSLFGSHSFFLSLNGGPANAHHLDEAIEDLKDRARVNAEMAAALRDLLAITDDPENDADPEESAFTFARDVLARYAALFQEPSASHAAGLRDAVMVSRDVLCGVYNALLVLRTMVKKAGLNLGEQKASEMLGWLEEVEPALPALSSMRALATTDRSA